MTESQGKEENLEMEEDLRTEEDLRIEEELQIEKKLRIEEELRIKEDLRVLDLRIEEINKAVDDIAGNDTGTEALSILNVSCYFATQSIDTTMFLSLVLNTEILKAAIKLLEQHQLVESDSDRNIVVVNELVQTVVRKKLKEQRKEEEIIEKAVELLFASTSGSNRCISDHAVSVLHFAKEYQSIFDESSCLAILIVKSLMEQHSYEEATLFGFKTFHLLKTVIGECHPETVKLRQLLWTLLGKEGSHIDTLDILLKPNNLYPTCSGEDIMTMQITIARVLCEASKYDRSLLIYDRFLANQHVTFAYSDSFLSVWHHYAVLLMHLGRYSESLEILEEVLSKMIAKKCKNAGRVVATREMIANVLLRQKKFQKALEVLENVYSDRRFRLGEMHELTLRTRRDIALVFQFLGRHREAREIYEELSEKFTKVLGELHAGTLVLQANLASLFCHENDYEAALDLYKDANENQMKILGEKHVDTLGVKLNIGSVLYKQGKKSETLQIFRNVLDGYIEIYGPKHEKTLDLLQSSDSLRISIYLEGFHSDAETVYSAVRLGILKVIRSLIEEGIDVNCRDRNGKIPLHHGAERGHLSVVNLLLGKGAIFDAEDENGCTPLQLADIPAVTNVLNFVKKLFEDVKSGKREQVAKHTSEHAAIVNAKDIAGWTPLHWAISKCNEYMVSLLLAVGADATQMTIKGNSTLHIACSKNQTRIVEKLMQSVNADKLIDYINSETFAGKNTPLHVAAKNGSVEIVRALLQNGAMFDIRNKENNTPLELSTDQNVRSVLIKIASLFVDAMSGDFQLLSKLQDADAGERLVLLNARNAENHTLSQILLINDYKSIISKLSIILKNSASE